jgi:tripartite-type tricarboxylate transporter receptor subunit TctC
MNTKLTPRFLSMVLFLPIFLICLVTGASAQSYPNKIIRVVVPLIAGGGGDLSARAVTDRLREHFGQPIVIDNRPGGGGVVGADIVAKSEPDGYTLGCVSDSSLAVSVHLVKNLPFDPIKDFSPITPVCEMASALVVHPSFPANSIKELIALAKAKPGKLDFSSPGTGLAMHLAGEIFKKMAGIDIVHVPYKGSIPATTAVLNGEVSLMFGLLSTTGPQIKAGKLKVLGVTTSRRSSLFPDIPTISESGLKGYDVFARFGFVAPAGTPKEIITMLNTEIVKILKMPSVKEIYFRLGAEPLSSTPEEYAVSIKEETVKWGAVIKEAKIPRQ